MTRGGGVGADTVEGRIAQEVACLGNTEQGDKAFEQGEVVLERGVDRGGQDAVHLGMAQPKGDIGQLVLAEGEPHWPEGAVRREVEGVMSQSPREAREAAEHVLSGAPVGAPADQPDDAPNAAQDVPAPWIERNRERSIQDG
jgi:hypothetical protein